MQLLQGVAERKADKALRQKKHILQLTKNKVQSAQARLKCKKKRCHRMSSSCFVRVELQLSMCFSVFFGMTFAH